MRVGGLLDQQTVNVATRFSRRQEDKPPDIPPAKASKAPKIESSDWLDLDRKLDLIGVGLVFGATVFVFSALSPAQAAIGGVHTIVGQLLGWGAIAVPFTMFAIGLWLIVRHFGDEPPTIDPIRLTGAALAFLGALALFQFIDSLGYPDQCGRDCVGQVVRQSYLDGRGGGLIGGWLYSALVINLTELGGFALVFMVLTIASMLTTRSSMAELAYCGHKRQPYRAFTHRAGSGSTTSSALEGAATAAGFGAGRQPCARHQARAGPTNGIANERARLA